MGTLYVGNCGFEEAPDFDLDVDPFGMDRLTRTFMGRRDKLAEFLKGLKKDLPDSEFKQLVLARYRARTDRTFATITVESAGLLNDELPEVEKQGGWQSATVQLESANGTQTEIDYAAPTTTFRYVTRERPKEQRYKGKIMATEAQYQIKARRGNKTGRLLRYNRTWTGAGITLPANVGADDFGYFVSVVTESFTFERVGRYWQVTEVNGGRITDTNEADLSLGTIPRIAAF